MYLIISNRVNATCDISVCKLLEQHVMAIFGPQLSESSPIVKAISDAKEIPNIQTRYDSNQRRGSCGVNLYPHPKALAKVNKYLIDFYRNRFVLNVKISNIDICKR